MMLLLIASAATPPTGRAFIPSGYQSYYVLGDSESIVKKAMDPATGYNNATAQPWSLFSIVSYLDMATVYVPAGPGLLVIEDLARKGITEVWLNPGADDPAVVERARQLGLEPIQACSIIGIGDSPSRY